MAGGPSLRSCTGGTVPGRRTGMVYRVGVPGEGTPSHALLGYTSSCMAGRIGLVSAPPRLGQSYI